MKKKLLLILSMIIMVACLFVVTTSAAASDYFGEVEIIDLDNDGVSDIKITDKITGVIYADNAEGVPATEDARVKLNCTCSKGSHTFPAYYIAYIDRNVPSELFSFNYSVLNGLRQEYCGSETDYSVASIVAFEFPNGITSAYNGLFGKKAATAIKYVSFAKCTTATGVRDASNGNNWFEETGLEEVDFGTTLKRIPTFFCYNCDSLTSVTIPDQVTTIGTFAFNNCGTLSTVNISKGSNISSLENACFKDCVSLEAFYIPPKLTQFGTSTNSNQSPIDGCTKLYFVHEPGEAKPTVYYFPSTLQGFTGEVFKGCKGLNDVLVFPESITNLENGWAFCNAKACTLVFLGDVTKLSTTGSGWTKQLAIYFCNANDIDASSFEKNTTNISSKFVYCNADGNTTHLVEPKKTETIPATCETNRFETTYCFCGAKIDDNKEIEDTELGHDHTILTAVVYTDYTANGTKTYKCSRDNCESTADTAIEAIIYNFTGYSAPVDPTKVGLCFGYDINVVALAEYNSVNEDLKFGVIGVLKTYLGTKTPLTSDGKINEEIDGNVIVADISNTNSKTIDFIITGSKEQWESTQTVNGVSTNLKELAIVMAGYVYDGANVHYIQSKGTTSTFETVSYNQVYTNE